MPSPAERSPFRLFAYGFLMLLALLAVIPGYLVLDATWRARVVRLVSAAAVAVGCLRIVASVRRSLEGREPSPLDVPRPARYRRELDERFLRLRDDLLFSTRSGRYFELHLWPRLVKLAGGELGVPPPEGRGGRRGPSLDALDRVIGEIERRGAS